LATRIIYWLFSTDIEKKAVDQSLFVKVIDMKEETKKANDNDIEDIQKGVKGGVMDVPKGARDDVGRGIDKKVSEGKIK
jgi:hypothetical protein